MSAPATLQRFGAPTGLRVRLSTWLCLAILPVVSLVGLVAVRFSELPPNEAWTVVLAPLAGLPVAAAIVVLSRIRGYRLADGTLVVDRFLRSDTIALAGLVEATVDREALRGAWKTLGNDGAGAICGRFHSRRLGHFRAFVTDPASLVLLRWPDRAVVVSPDRPAAFVAAARRHAGLHH